jgi:hypothetical protein
LTLPQPQVVDDPDASSFPAPGDAPPQFPNATGSANDVTGLRVGDDRVLQLRVLVIGEVVLDEPREQLRTLQGWLLGLDSNQQPSGNRMQQVVYLVDSSCL